MFVQMMSENKPHAFFHKNRAVQIRRSVEFRKPSCVCTVCMMWALDKYSFIKANPMLTVGKLPHTATYMITCTIVLIYLPTTKYMWEAGWRAQFMYDVICTVCM
jgi:hypothetical protein